MLRIHFIMHWFNLADLACKDAFTTAPPCAVLDIDLGRKQVPDATTLLKFCRLLNGHKLKVALFAQVGAVLQSKVFKVHACTIVDATIINAPSLNRNADNICDPRCARPARASNGISA